MSPGWPAALAALAAAGCLDAPPGPLADANLTATLLARYSFDGDDSLEDSSGNQHHARCQGAACPEFIIGKETDDRAAAFDGVDDLVTLDPTGVGPFTVMARVRVDSTLGVALACPINRLFGAGLNSWQICVQVPDEGARRVFFFTSQEPSRLEAPVDMTTGDWHHVAIRWDGSRKTIWWNGDVVVAGEGKTDFDESEIRFGSDLDEGVPVGVFKGVLDDIEIWSGVLTEDAIRDAAGL